MNVGRNRKTAATVAAVMVGLGVTAFSGTSASAQVAVGIPGGPMRGERHPELRRALRTLERTEADLRRSARDFGGHRERAADLCHQAEQEIQLALQYDGR